MISEIFTIPKAARYLQLDSELVLSKLLRDTRRAAKRTGIETEADVDRLVHEARRKRKPH